MVALPDHVGTTGDRGAPPAGTRSATTTDRHKIDLAPWWHLVIVLAALGVIPLLLAPGWAARTAGDSYTAVLLYSRYRGHRRRTRRRHPSTPAGGWLLQLTKDEDVEHNLDAPLLLEALNTRIEDRDLAIGPSYLMRAGVYRHEEGMDRVWETSILQLLAEHHYGSPPAVLDRYGLPVLRAALAAQQPAPEPPP